MANIVWSGWQAGKLYLNSGVFTTTVKTSVSIGGIDTNVTGVSWDGINTPWSGNTADKLYLQSGQFTSTLKTSVSVAGIDATTRAISWDGVNTPWTGGVGVKLYLQSGQFTSTLKTSWATSAIETVPTGISWDGVNTPWGGEGDDKLYLQSGQFTSTLKTSVYIGGVEAQPRGITWNGVDTPWIGQADDKFYLQSGQFTSTLKTSTPIGAIDTFPWGMETDDQDARFGVVHITVTPSEIALGLSQGSLSFPGMEVTVVIGSELSLTSAVAAPSISGTANVPVATLALGMVQEGVTFIAGIDVFVSLLPIAITAEIAGAVVVSGDAVLLLPNTSMILLELGLSVHAPTINITNDVRILVTNTRNFAISEYSNFGFNSMCKFNGKYLYAKSDGIYEDGGDDDNGTEINASYKTGAVDIYSTEIQRLTEAFLNFRSNGNIQLFSVGEEVNTRTYPITLSTAATIHERRVKFEQGIRDRHFNFGVSNVNGSTLEIDSVKIMSEPIRKRR